MKFIHQINQYLLARYPSLWNTKIVWMLCVAFVIHIFFFAVGYFFFQNPETLQTYDIYDIYYSSAFFIFQIIISLILLVVWLIQLFKNNAFKHFYPMSSLQLFGQFLQFMVIVFACLSFHLSFRLGNYVFANQRYDDATYTHFIHTANKAYPFLPMEAEKYMPDSHYLLNDLYCETDYQEIDSTKPYLLFVNKIYQFYTTYTDSLQLNEEYDYQQYKERVSRKDFIVTRDTENEIIFRYKKDVIDMSDVFVDAYPNLRNFSEVFHVPYDSDISYLDLKKIQTLAYNGKDSVRLPMDGVLNGYVNKLLDSKNEQAIKNIMEQFLQMSDVLKIETNLDTEGWFEKVYRPEANFRIEHFFRKNALESYYDRFDYYEDDGKLKEFYEKFKNETSDYVTLYGYEQHYLSHYYYYEIDKLQRILENIEKLRTFFIDDTDTALVVYLWLSVGISLLLLFYRVFSLKSLLLGFVVLNGTSLVIGLFFLIMKFSGVFYQDYQAAILIIIIYLSILVTTLFMPYERNKTFASILMNVSVLAFPLVFFLAFLGVDMYQKKQRYSYIDYAYDNHYLVENYNQETLLDWLGVEGLSLVVFLGTLIFVLFYIRVIMRWKATSE
ncbi:hypothetical protein [Capnocytophaga canimorsus]|uniref:hypothetical protein n=1 Tax=Capnocytophaga canimorsus TaxID=28188 RepID=UPI000F515879|nr:hypothetical protein [Capnocytophaga canimorsus]MDT9499459.1 hypothetical protein [Capnocytophaga canimorsus]